MADKTEIDYDSMSDDEFMEALEVGSLEEITEEEIVEDTNQEEESFEEDNEETETEQDDDENLEDTGSEYETEEEDELEGNTQIETSNDEEETEESEEETDKTEEKESDESETNENPAEDGKETDKINYEEQYKQLLGDNEKLKGFENFYNEVTSEFMANGKKIKGFTDPKKIIESQQMAAGFSDKMAGFSKYKPFMNTLKDKGMLDSPEKFSLAMNLLDGDQEAIKQHIKNLEIDPFEMDMENIDYKGKNQVSSNLEIAYDEILEDAGINNVRSEVQNVIRDDWDDKSVIDLLEDKQSSADLVNHISTGAYKIVQERIAEKKRTDVNHVYSSKPMIEQYREAARELEGEFINNANAQQEIQNQQHNQEIDEDAVQAEIARIEQERSDDEYRSKVEKQNAKANEARKKATSVSKKKPRTKTTKKVFDPGSANDDQFTKYLDSLIYS